MSTFKGYFSLVQYCPDMSRAEGANIGVVLLVPEVGFVRARMATGNDRIRRFFGPDADGPGHLNAMKQALASRIQVERTTFKTVDDLDRFASLQANRLTMTKPRFVKVTDAERDLDQLFRELVGARTRRELPDEVAPVRRLLSRTFEKENLNQYLQRDVTVKVPAFHTEITVPFAFKNGALNLIQPARFQQETVAGVRSAACQLAVEGVSLQRHPDSRLGPLALVVVAAFRKTAQEEERIVRDILSENNVTLFSWQQVHQLTEKIRTTATPVNS